jgi:hypothetical protein
LLLEGDSVDWGFNNKGAKQYLNWQQQSEGFASLPFDHLVAIDTIDAIEERFDVGGRRYEERQWRAPSRRLPDDQRFVAGC